MANIFNVEKLKFEERKAGLPEFSWHTSPRLAELVQSKYLQMDIRSLDSGKFSFPYHFHRASEEFFFIIFGEATLRTPEGFQRVFKGDFAFFNEGAEGAHQLYNHSDQACLYLDVRTKMGIDVVEYPDSGKINILPYQEIYETSSKVDYYKGEEGVDARWPKELLRKS